MDSQDSSPGTQTTPENRPGRDAFAELSEEEAKVARRRKWMMGFLIVLLLLASTAVYVASDVIGGAYVLRANERYSYGDVEGAIADLNQAESWSEEDASIYQTRLWIRLREHRAPEEALADADKFVAMADNYPPALTMRGQVLQWMAMRNPDEAADFHRRAIDDYKEARELSPVADPMPHNNLAYARGLAEMEVEAGLEDAEKAVSLLEELADGKWPPDLKASRCAILDTRGLLRHLNGQHEEALADLDEALKLAEEVRDEMIEAIKENGGAPAKVAVERTKRTWDETRGVILNHRARVHKELGNGPQAQADEQQARKLGYDPAGGVF